MKVSVVKGGKVVGEMNIPGSKLGDRVRVRQFVTSFPSVVLPEYEFNIERFVVDRRPLLAIDASHITMRDLRNIAGFEEA